MESNNSKKSIVSDEELSKVQGGSTLSCSYFQQEDVCKNNGCTWIKIDDRGECVGY